MPDNYLRLEETMLTLRRTGFAGFHVIYEEVPLREGTRTGGGAAQDQLRLEQVQLARLSLGLLAETRTAIPIRLGAAGRSRSADTVQCSGKDGFAGVLACDSTTHLPIGFTYRDRVPFPTKGQPSSAGSVVTGRMPPFEDADVTVVFEDRRPVGSVLLPWRILTVSRGITFEEVSVEQYLVNPALTAVDFRSPKPGAAAPKV